jgi:hypothetical protein
MQHHKAARPANPKVRKPHAPLSSGKVRGRDATSQIDIMQALAVFDSRTCLGHIMPRGESGIEAYDRDDRSLGVFSDQKAAADALAAKASS